MRKSYVIYLDLKYTPRCKNKQPGSESSLDARSEDDEQVTTLARGHEDSRVSTRGHEDPRGNARSHEDDYGVQRGDNEDVQNGDTSHQQLTDLEEAQSQQRYIVETITMTTVTERRIVREAEDSQKRSQSQSPDSQNYESAKLGGILKGGKQWKSDKVKGDYEEVTSFASPVSPDDADSFERRNVRFTHESDGTQTVDDVDTPDAGLDSPDDQERGSLEPPSPDSTELTLTFKLGNHVLVANSLNPNSAVRQLFPAQRFPSPNQKLPQDSEDERQENGEVAKSTPQQYLVTSESLKLFEESKRARVANYYNNQESNLSNGAEDDVPVNTNLIKRTIERNTLRRSLLRYEPGKHKRCMKRNDENSLVERIKQLTCDVDEPIYDYGENVERTSPTGEESKPSVINNDLKTNVVSPHETVANGVRLSPSSSSSSSGSTASTYKKLTDLFARRNEKPTQDQIDHMNMSQEYLVNADYSNSVYLSPPDLGNGLPLHVTPPKDFGVERGGHQNFISPRSVMTKTSSTSEARKQFLSTLAPLTACVGAGISNGGEEGDYYHVSPGMLPHNLRMGDRTSVASTNTESGYSLNDIDEVLEDENSQPQPDLVAGTQTYQATDNRPPIPAKPSIKNLSNGSGPPGVAPKQAEARGKVAGNQGNAQKTATKATGNQGSSMKASGKQKGSPAQGAGSKTSTGAQIQDPTDELALFVQQDASRTERIKKRYSLNSSPPNNSDDENDDYGFNRRPSVRGIKPRFGSTEEIMQQMQSQMQPPALACNARVGNHGSWPYQVETPPRKGVPVRSPQMPCVQEENVVYYGNYNGNNGCTNQNFVGQQVCANHAHMGCNHQAVGCVQNQSQTENHVKDSMGRKYVSNSMIYASTGNLYENQNQIMRIGGGCSDAHVYGSLGVRYLHHQTHLQHPRTSSPPPPGVHRDYQAYNGGAVMQPNEGLPPCMHHDPRFTADLQNCQHNKERRFSGDVLPLNQKEPRYAVDTVANQQEMRYSGEGLPNPMPNCTHLERYAELAITNPADPRYYQTEMNTNQRYAGVGEVVSTDSPNALYQDPRGSQSLDRSYAGRRCSPNVAQLRVSPTSSTQTQQYQTTLSSTSVRMAAPFPDPNITAIIDPHYSTYRPPNPQMRVNIAQQQQTVKLPYPGPPVQVHLMARGVRSESPQRCGSPVMGTAAAAAMYQQCVMARGTQTAAMQQSYQGRGYYGQVAENAGEGSLGYDMGYQDTQGGTPQNNHVMETDPNQSVTLDSNQVNEKSIQNGGYDNQSQYRPQMNAQILNTSFQNQSNMSPTKYSTERGVPEGAASVPTNYPQDSQYSTAGSTTTSPTEPTNQMAPSTISSAPGVYYAMNV